MATLQRVRRRECFLLIYEWYGWTVMKEDRSKKSPRVETRRRRANEVHTLEYLCHIFCSASVGMGTGYP
jgi:hypothetical protein